jgi:exodeoxyribonuclease V alpha subunit
LRIALAAPTGKAAARLTNRSARSTSPEGDDPPSIPVTAGLSYFRHDAEHPLNADVVIVDEASMIDLRSWQNSSTRSGRKPV